VKVTPKMTKRPRSKRSRSGAIANASRRSAASTSHTINAGTPESGTTSMMTAADAKYPASSTVSPLTLASPDRVAFINRSGASVPLRTRMAKRIIAVTSEPSDGTTSVTAPPGRIDPSRTTVRKSSGRRQASASALICAAAATASG
jgi:hypothetical protein